MELRRAVLAVAGRRPVRSLAPWPEGHRWAALVTHDLDVVEWWGLFPLLRMAQLATKGDWNLFARVAPGRQAQRRPGSSDAEECTPCFSSRPITGSERPGS